MRTQNEELKPIYDGAKSFYGKAWTYCEDGALYLVSYGTVVAVIEADGSAEVGGMYSKTTLRHIKEFLKQNGYKADSWRQMKKDYVYEDVSEK